KGNFAEVQTKVVSSKAELPLDYRLLNKNGDYRVYDVVIDGVSLVKNYRGQFSRIIKSSSYDGLLEKLRTKSDQFSKPK
ncbi:MAG: ABC transporter substrate-binding protein, partial [Nitrospirota bacterium]